MEVQLRKELLEAKQRFAQLEPASIYFFSKKRTSQLLIREFSFLSIAFFASVQFTVFKSV